MFVYILTGAPIVPLKKTKKQTNKKIPTKTLLSMGNMHTPVRGRNNSYITNHLQDNTYQNVI